MKCPHCNIKIIVEWKKTSAYEDYYYNPPAEGYQITHDYQIAHGCCPECNGIIIKLIQGNISASANSATTFYVYEVQSDEVVYPKFMARPIENEVPEPYKSEFKEATTILGISPKASAALSRRILQNVLHQQFGIQKRTLADEIDEFIHLKGVPPHLAGAVDAVRNIGNFGAHPLKDTSTGEIVDVEPGEAEWILDVLESLFDFAFVQPIRLEERKQKLNDKLLAQSETPNKACT